VDIQITELLARRYVNLQPGDAIAKAVSPPPSWKNEAHTWSDRRMVLRFLEELVAIVHEHVVHALRRAEVREGKRVGNLVTLDGDRPFLGEHRRPTSSSVPAERKDVLDDTSFLVEGFLNEK
jgi:hypothetical protein